MVYRLLSGRRVALLGVLACLAAVGILLVGSSTLFAATAPHPRVAMSLAQPGQAAAGTAPKQVNYLWSIPSASGSLTGPDDQHLVLRLVGVRNYLTRFTDRPVGQAFVVANADFLRRFKVYFAGANPNAVLSFRKAGSRIPTEIVLNIGQPRWNPRTSTLTFSAVRILKREDNLPDTTVHIKPPVIPNPRHFDQASLFIDSGSSSQQVNYLWSIPSASGSLTGPDDQHLVLRLVGVRNYLTRFTDRPVRQAFVVANADFLRRFKVYFAGANPNAVLSFRKAGSRIPTEIVLNIGQPRWNPRTSTLTFSAVRILKREDNLPDTTVHIKPPVIPNPRHFDQASLFIDSGSTSPVCSQSGSTATCTYLLTGTTQTFTVSAGVTSLQIVAVGGQGGSGLGGPGGNGAKVAGTLSGVSPGQVLYVIVGGNGGNGSGADANGQPGGFYGGGAGETARPGAAAAAALLRSTSPSFPRSSASSSRLAAGALRAPSLTEATRGWTEGATPSSSQPPVGARGPRRPAVPAAAKPRCTPPTSVLLRLAFAGRRVVSSMAGTVATLMESMFLAAEAAAVAGTAEVAEPSGRVEVAVRATSQPLHLAWSRTTTAPPPRSSSAGRCREGDHHDPGTPRRPRRKGSAPSRALAARIFRTVRGAGRARIRTASPPARRSDTSTLGWDSFTLLTVQDVAAYLQLNQQARLPQRSRTSTAPSRPEPEGKPRPGSRRRRLLLWPSC